ncbi:hypothetical protein [Flavobacterium sp.]|uniref:hypothetical protein n=1 Tax=Flavobacterium sp. TaxID=239 RepID=UPI00374D706A
MKVTNYINPGEIPGNYLLISAPVYSGDNGDLYLQILNPVTNCIESFIETDEQITNLVVCEETVFCSKGDEGFVVVLYNGKADVCTINNANKLILKYLATYKLSAYNKFSLYCFLSLPDKVLNSIQDINNERELRGYKKLSDRNFILPESIDIFDNSIFVKAILYRYANIVFNSRKNISVTELLNSNPHYVNSGDYPDDFFNIGNVVINKKHFEKYANENQIESKPYNSLDEIFLNDFVVNVLLLKRMEISSGMRIIEYTDSSLLKSSETNNNSDYLGISLIQCRSGTAYTGKIERIRNIVEQVHNIEWKIANELFENNNPIDSKKEKNNIERRSNTIMNEYNLIREEIKRHNRELTEC